MVAAGSFVLVSTPHGLGVAARVDSCVQGELALHTIDGDLGTAGLDRSMRVDVEYSVSGDATYCVGSIVTDIDQHGGRLTLLVVDEPSRVQARRFVRMETELRVRVALVDGDRETTLLGTFPGNDLSAGGLSLRLPTDQPLDVGDVVSCRFQLSTRQGPLTVMSDAVVVRRDDDGCGLAFRPLPARLEQALVAAINWHLVKRRVA